MDFIDLTDDCIFIILINDVVLLIGNDESLLIV